VVKIPQGDHGRNGVGFALVNEPLQPRHGWTCTLLGFGTYVAQNPHFSSIVRTIPEILLTVRACASFCSRAGQRMFAMFEMVTAVMGLVGAGIFIAHAFEGVLSRA
jgi:hypothetical protein